MFDMKMGLYLIIIISAVVNILENIFLGASNPTFLITGTMAFVGYAIVDAIERTSKNMKGD